MEGTGSAGGLAIMLAKWIYGIPYIVSSGDAIAPFLGARWPVAKSVFALFEWLLYRNSSGFIGWTPYLVGRALTMGAPKGMTAAGWAPFRYSEPQLAESRWRVRRSLGIPEDAIVFGIAGSLIWSKRWNYCYGHELVQAILAVKNPAVRVLIVGDGDGLGRLREIAGSKLGETIFLPGRVPRKQVPEYLSAMDAVTLPQSVDNVGSFRYTTKVSEYLSVRVPLITNQIPAAYDLDYGGVWRLPGTTPWDPCFVDALADLMDRLTLEAIEQKRSAIPNYLPVFDRARQIETTAEFITEILTETAARKR
jgi:glycosyltransferase involved in cell wall biosynthesis